MASRAAFVSLTSLGLLAITASALTLNKTLTASSEHGGAAVRIDFPYDVDLFGVAAVSDEEAVVVGRAGLMAVRSGGEWNILDLGIDSTLTDVAVLDGEVLWVVGADSVIGRVSSGKWERIPVVVEADFDGLLPRGEHIMAYGTEEGSRGAVRWIIDGEAAATWHRYLPVPLTGASLGPGGNLWFVGGRSGSGDSFNEWYIAQERVFDDPPSAHWMYDTERTWDSAPLYSMAWSGQHGLDVGIAVGGDSRSGTYIMLADDRRRPRYWEQWRIDGARLRSVTHDTSGDRWWAVGDDGQIATFNEEGIETSWKLAGAPNLHDIDFGSSNAVQGWIVGENGYIARIERTTYFHNTLMLPIAHK